MPVRLRSSPFNESISQLHNCCRLLLQRPSHRNHGSCWTGNVFPPHGLCGSVVSFANSNPPTPERTEPNHFLRIRCSLGSVERRNYVTLFLNLSTVHGSRGEVEIEESADCDSQTPPSTAVTPCEATRFERTAVRRCGAEQQHSLESWLQQCGVPEEGDLRLFWGQRADPSQVRLLLSLSMTPWSSEEVRFVIDGAGG